jgi:hypothetical protein
MFLWAEDEFAGARPSPRAGHASPASAAMTTCLSIRIEVDTQHAREALGVGVGAPVDASTVVAALGALRLRLLGDLAAAYPHAHVVVVARPGTHGARPTQVRAGRRRYSAGADAERVLVAEHADALRDAAIRSLATRSDWVLDAAATAADIRRWASVASERPGAHAA